VTETPPPTPPPHQAEATTAAHEAGGPPPGRPGVQVQPAPPPVNAGWAVAALLFFWPLAFSAFSHAFNVYPLWARGDAAEAWAASERVRRLGQMSLWLFGGLLFLFAIGYTALIIAWLSYGGDMPRHGHHDWNRDGYGGPGE
jgi:hypothetical protein